MILLIIHDCIFNWGSWKSFRIDHDNNNNFYRREQNGIYRSASLMRIHYWNIIHTHRIIIIWYIYRCNEHLLKHTLLVSYLHYFSIIDAHHRYYDYYDCVPYLYLWNVQRMDASFHAKRIMMINIMYESDNNNNRICDMVLSIYACLTRYSSSFRF